VEFEGVEEIDRDRKIAGVCGGFGEYTPVPAWLWRVAFSPVFVGG
jgi:phage shock protein PspC (stress-responsive transcriptional regulator)